MWDRWRDAVAGVFRFYFWRFGEWQEVVIDDRLPTYRGKDLMFCHNRKEPNEFWTALIEKAYAKWKKHHITNQRFISSIFHSEINLTQDKRFPYGFRLHGSYEALEGGWTEDALVDFTGVGGRRVDLTDKEKIKSSSLFRSIRKGFVRSSLLACSIHVSRDVTHSNTSVAPLRHVVFGGLTKNKIRSTRQKYWLNISQATTNWI